MIETWLAWVIFAEVLITLFILWGFMHEDKFILFEDRIIYHIKNKLSKRRKNKVTK